MKTASKNSGLKFVSVKKFIRPVQWLYDANLPIGFGVSRPWRVGNIISIAAAVVDTIEKSTVASTER